MSIRPVGLVINISSSIFFAYRIFYDSLENIFVQLDMFILVLYKNVKQNIFNK